MARNILDRIRYLAYMKDRGIETADAQLRGALIRLRRQNPYMLRLPQPLKVDLAEDRDE